MPKTARISFLCSFKAERITRAARESGCSSKMCWMKFPSPAYLTFSPQTMHVVGIEPTPFA